MNELTVLEQKMVHFNGTELMAVKMNDGKIYAGVKWVCEGIGLTIGQMQNERKKMREDLVLKQGARNLVLPTNGGLQEVSCIDLEYLPLWLAKISITPKMQSESPWIVNRLIQFQLKVRDVLAEAFFNKPKTQAELIAMMAQQNVEQERRLQQVELRVIENEQKQDNIVKILSLNPVEWRRKVNSLINQIALSISDYDSHKKIRNESYSLLEERAKCNLKVRLNNKRQKMALEGVAKLKIDKVNKMDVIAEDARLTEVYLSIVKEMGIRYNVKAGHIS